LLAIGVNLNGADWLVSKQDVAKYPSSRSSEEMQGSKFLHKYPSFNNDMYFCSSSIVQFNGSGFDDVFLEHGEDCFIVVN